MTYDNFIMVVKFFKTFNSNRDSFTTKQLMDFADAFRTDLYHWKREMMILTYSKHNSSQTKHITQNISVDMIEDCINTLQVLDYKNGFCSQTNEQIIYQCIDNCIGTLQNIKRTLQKLQYNDKQVNFYNPHQDYSFHSNISNEEFIKVYNKYLQMGCYSDNYTTFSSLRYFVCGNQRPYLTENVNWQNNLAVLKDFLTDMGCITSKPNNWKEIAEKIFTIKNTDNTIEFINFEYNLVNH